MKKFDVEITETLQRTVSVEADSRAEAERLVTEAWNNEDYVLDSTDFVGVDFKTVGEQELSENRKMEILLVQPGMARFLALYQGEYSRERLILRLRTVHPKTITRLAQNDTGNVADRHMKQILSIYNGAGRAHSLPCKR